MEPIFVNEVQNYQIPLFIFFKGQGTTAIQKGRLGVILAWKPTS